MSHSLSITLIVCTAFLISSCHRESRIENRLARLNTFRSALPRDLRYDFDEIESREDCDAAGLRLEEARADDSTFDAVIDSIVHAELIDTFNDEDIIYFFWYYFAHAIETGSVRGP